MLRTIYKPLPETTIEDPLDPSKTISVRRWKLMADMPHYGISVGALTGYIDTKINISRAKNVWIDFTAIVYGLVILKDKVAIRDYAIVRGFKHGDKKKNCGLYLRNNVTIKENSILGYGRQGENDSAHISENIVIKGNAHVSLPKHIHENVTISGEVFIGEKVVIADNVEISEHAYIDKGAVIWDKVYISGNTRIGSSCSINSGLKMDKDLEILPFTKISEGKVLKTGSLTIIHDEDGQEIFDAHQVIATNAEKISHLTAEIDVINQSKAPSEIEEKKNVTSQRKEWMDIFSDVIQSMNSYNSDIVKIIKYPVMTDLTNPFTAAMVFARKNAERSIDKQDDEFIATIIDLEQKFLIAESNAHKIASTAFTDEELKRTQQAQDLFALACNEATSEHEKRKAFKQGFNRLEGIIAIPDQAIEAMRAKVGIAEIEM